MSEPLLIESLNFSCLAEKCRGVIEWGGIQYMMLKLKKNGKLLILNFKEIEGF